MNKEDCRGTRVSEKANMAEQKKLEPGTLNWQKTKRSKQTCSKDTWKLWDLEAPGTTGWGGAHGIELNIEVLVPSLLFLPCTARQPLHPLHPNLSDATAKRLSKEKEGNTHSLWLQDKSVQFILLPMVPTAMLPSCANESHPWNFGWKQEARDTFLLQGLLNWQPPDLHFLGVTFPQGREITQK